MFIPIGDQPAPRGSPAFATYVLIAVNVLVYALVTLPLSGQGVDPYDPLVAEYLRALGPQLQGLTSAALSAYDLVVFQHGYKPGAPELSDLGAAMFLHSGFMHLAGNMLFLYIFGRNVEQRMGRAPYLLAYGATGVAATLAFGLLAGDSLRPLVGASGAISGVLGLYFLMFPRNKVRVFIALFPIFFRAVYLPARWVLGFYVVAQNILPWLENVDSQVAYGAHLGGFAAGLGAAWLGEKWRTKGGAAAAGPVESMGSSPTLVSLQSAIQFQDTERVAQLVGAMLPAEAAQLEGKSCVRLARWLGQRGQPVVALTLLRRWLAANPLASAADQAMVHLDLGLVLLANQRSTAAAQHFLAVLDLDADGEGAAKAREALAAIGWT